MLNASEAFLFELLQSGENAFHITVTDNYTIDFTNAPEIQSILGFESSVHVKWLDNPRLFFLSTSCNQIVVTNDTMSYVLSTPTGYYSFLEFIEAVGSEMVKVLSIISMMIEEEYVTFNVQKERWYFDRESEDTTIDGFDRTPGSNYLHPYISWLERFVNGSVYDNNHRPCLMWRTIKVCEVMQTSIHPLSNRTGNCVPRTTDLSCSLSYHTQWQIVMVHCSVLVYSMWPRTRLYHIPWTHWWIRVWRYSIIDMLEWQVVLRQAMIIWSSILLT